MERYDFAGRRALSALFAVPLAIPAFISSYAWVSISPLFEQFGGALLVLSCSYFPLVYLPVAAALRGLDPALEEAARVFGTPRSVALRVVLPQLRPALLGGMLLVALNTLVEFGAFSLLRFRTFTTQIFAEYRTGFNGPEASLLAVVLILLCLVCLLIELRVRGQARYAGVGRGSRRPARASWPAGGAARFRGQRVAAAGDDRRAVGMIGSGCCIEVRPLRRRCWPHQNCCWVPRCFQSATA